MENQTPEIDPVPDGYIWCEHCGYNRSLTTDQLRELNGDVVETWCPECDEAMLNHGAECPDHIHLDLPLLPLIEDQEPLRLTQDQSDRLDRWRAQGVEHVPPCLRCGRCGFIEDAAMNLAGVCPECNGTGRALKSDCAVDETADEQRGRSAYNANVLPQGDY